MALVWPWAVTDPLNPFRALEYFSHFFEEPWQELFGGQLISVPDMPRSYVPTLFALKLPEVFWLLALIGTAGAIVAACRRDVPLPRRAAYLLVALAAMLPVAVDDRAAAGDVQRHPPFRLRAAAARGARRPRRRAYLIGLLRRSRRCRRAAVALFALGIASAGRRDDAAASVRVHLLQPARRRRRRRAAPLHARLLGTVVQTGLAGLAGDACKREAKPAGRRWKVAVCGPHRSPQVELGPDFETTWDPHGADFAMMLGVFYCARLDAPLIVEIERDGVRLCAGLRYPRTPDRQRCLAPAKLEPLS